MTATPTSVLQMGFGGFSAVHLEAWRRLRADVWIWRPSLLRPQQPPDGPLTHGTTVERPTGPVRARHCISPERA